MPTHTHVISGNTNNNSGTETIVKNIGINYIIKSKLSNSNTSNTITVVSDRIAKGDGLLV